MTMRPHVKPSRTRPQKMIFNRLNRGLRLLAYSSRIIRCLGILRRLKISLMWLPSAEIAPLQQINPIMGGQDCGEAVATNSGMLLNIKKPIKLRPCATQVRPMLNMDFSRPIVCDTTKMEWFPSPKPGVWRKPLAREEKERGHATSIVRYDPGASFHGHDHPGGEEILVLEGTFSDATGDFHAGTYFRNPAGFIHAPFSKQGCVILVKLHQFQPDDTRRLAIETD